MCIVVEAAVHTFLPHSLKGTGVILCVGLDALLSGQRKVSSAVILYRFYIWKKVVKLHTKVIE